MHPLTVVFWIFFAAIIVRVGWSFVEMFLGKARPAGKRPVNRTEVNVQGAGGSLTDTNAGDWLGASDGGSIETTSADSGAGWESGGDTGGSFGSDGGSDSGGGGGGGW